MWTKCWRNWHKGKQKLNFEKRSKWNSFFTFYKIIWNFIIKYFDITCQLFVSISKQVCSYMTSHLLWDLFINMHTIANFMSHMKVKKLTLNKATSSSLRSFIDNPKADLKNYSVNLIVRFVLYRIYLNHSAEIY